MTKFLLTTTALVAFTAYASAADLPARSKAPALVATPFSWNGFYLGATLGGNRHQTRFAAPNGGWSMAPGDSFTTQGVGLIGGATAGFNMQFGSYVAGLETDYSFANTDDSRSVNFNNLVEGQSRLKSIGTLRARAGMAFDHTLVYATGGWAFARTSTFLDETNGYGYSRNKNSNGWTLGAGVEQALGNGFSVKGEALYYNLGHSSVTQPGPFSSTYREGNDGVIVRVGLNYSFGAAALPSLSRF